MVGEGLSQPATDGREVSSTVVSEGDTESVTDPIESTGSVLVRFWDSDVSDAEFVTIGWGEDTGPFDGFPLLIEESISLDLDTAQQDIYVHAVNGDADIRVIATN